MATAGRRPSSLSLSVGVGDSPSVDLWRVPSIPGEYQCHRVARLLTCHFREKRMSRSLCQSEVFSAVVTLSNFVIRTQRFCAGGRCHYDQIFVTQVKMCPTKSAKRKRKHQLFSCVRALNTWSPIEISAAGVYQLPTCTKHHLLFGYLPHLHNPYHNSDLQRSNVGVVEGP